MQQFRTNICIQFPLCFAYRLAVFGRLQVNFSGSVRMLGLAGRQAIFLPSLSLSLLFDSTVFREATIEPHLRLGQTCCFWFSIFRRFFFCVCCTKLDQLEFEMLKMIFLKPWVREDPEGVRWNLLLQAEMQQKFPDRFSLFMSEMSEDVV